MSGDTITKFGEWWSWWHPFARARGWVHMTAADDGTHLTLNTRAAELGGRSRLPDKIGSAGSHLKKQSGKGSKETLSISLHMCTSIHTHTHAYAHTHTHTEIHLKRILSRVDKCGLKFRNHRSLPIGCYSKNPHPSSLLLVNLFFNNLEALRPSPGSGQF